MSALTNARPGSNESHLHSLVLVYLVVTDVCKRAKMLNYDYNGYKKLTTSPSDPLSSLLLLLLSYRLSLARLRFEAFLVGLDFLLFLLR